MDETITVNAWLNIDGITRHQRLVVAVVSNGETDRQVRRAPTVDFSRHLEGIREMGDAYGAGDSTLIVNACANHICGSVEDKIGNGVVSTVGGFSRKHWYVQVFAKPAVGPDAEFAHRLFVPVVPGFFERAADIERFVWIESRRAVVHKSDV